MFTNCLITVGGSVLSDPMTRTSTLSKSGGKFDAVVLRFIEQGLSAEETAVRMDMPIDFVMSCLNKL